MSHTWAKHKPIVPVPQQTSTTVVFLFASANSMAELYKISAASLLIWKNASGDTRNFKPNKFSVICVSPKRYSGCCVSFADFLLTKKMHAQQYSIQKKIDKNALFCNFLIIQRRDCRIFSSTIFEKIHQISLKISQFFFGKLLGVDSNHQHQLILCASHHNLLKMARMVFRIEHLQIGWAYKNFENFRRFFHRVWNMREIIYRTNACNSIHIAAYAKTYSWQVVFLVYSYCKFAFVAITKIFV